MLGERYFGGLYTVEKDGVSGARTKAQDRLGAIIFSMPSMSRAEKEAHADAAAEILDWFDDGGGQDMMPADPGWPRVNGKPVSPVFLSILEGAPGPWTKIDLAAGLAQWEAYMGWAANPPIDTRPTEK